MLASPLTPVQLAAPLSNPELARRFPPGTGVGEGVGVEVGAAVGVGVGVEVAPPGVDVGVEVGVGPPVGVGNKVGKTPVVAMEGALPLAI